MNDSTNSTSKYTFWRLLKEYYVVIPRLQRDYVQGRDNERVTAIREELLTSIYDALCTGNGLDFDFIYGTVIDEKLYPLDGQQRLTTLYLLHWYIASKENRMDEAIHVLDKFSYETRISSREFCSMLMDVDYQPQMDELPSDYIRNENGYFKSWDLDPTISHMLTMLDSIHSLFYDTEDLFDLLTSDDEDILTFNYLPMEHYALSDDLYIKMNARGKALTDFENFKAKFIQHLKDKGLPYEHFEECIDVKWTDLLWDYRSKDNTIDEQFLNLFCYITEMLFLDSSEPREGDSPFRPNQIRGLINYYESDDSVNSLYAYLDLWANKDEVAEFLNKAFTVEHEPDKVQLFEGPTDIFSSIVNGESVSLANKIILYAAMKRYLILGADDSQESFNDYIRIVRNFLINTRFFSKKKCIYSSDLRYGRHGIPIMQYFINTIINSSFPYETLCNSVFERVNSEICEYEKQKACFILENPDKKALVHALEDMDIFKGTLINIMPYIINNDDEDIVNNLYCLSQFNDPKLIQAMLSIDDYGIRIGNSTFGDRFFYGDVSNWYSLFTYSGGKDYSDFICRFVEEFERTSSTEVDDALDEIIEANLPSIDVLDWRYTIIKYSSTVEVIDKYMNNPCIVFAKEPCDTYQYLIHRTNGIIMNGYHVIPEYLEIQKRIGDILIEDVRSHSTDEAKQGAICLPWSEELAVSYDTNGDFSIRCLEDDQMIMEQAYEEYEKRVDSHQDRVEKCLLLCIVIKNTYEKYNSLD